MDFKRIRRRGLEPLFLPNNREILASERGFKPLLHSRIRLAGIPQNLMRASIAGGPTQFELVFLSELGFKSEQQAVG